MVEKEHFNTKIFFHCHVGKQSWRVKIEASVILYGTLMYLKGFKTLEKIAYFFSIAYNL
jgi:hypothetical protein